MPAQHNSNSHHLQQRRSRANNNSNHHTSNTNDNHNDQNQEKIYSFPSTCDFPTEVDADSFPELPYTTRRGAVKSVIHYGQRKLLLSEMQILIEALEDAITRKTASSPNNNDKKFTIVYPGSAPGTHLPYLDKLFPGHEWILIDPIRFNNKFYNNNNNTTDDIALDNFRLINGYFTAQSCLSLVGERLMMKRKLPALATVLTHAATGGEYSKVFPLDEKVQRAEEDANLIRGVKAVDDDNNDNDNDNDNKTSTQSTSSLPNRISSFLRDRNRGINLLVDAALTTSSSSSCSSSSSSTTAEPTVRDILFISDIRSGSSTLTEDNANEPEKLSAEFESHIINDMRIQMEWVEMLRPKFAILKFRLPYMEVYDPISKKVVHRHPETHTEYLAGKVLLPIWTRPTSTECRLLVPQGAPRIQYDNRKFENQMFFFNTVLRENVHFQHLIEGHRSSFLDHRYDGTAEVQLLTRYLKIMKPEILLTSSSSSSLLLLQGEILRLSQEISNHSGKSFEFAANRLNELALERAKERGFLEVQQRIVKKCEEKRAMDIWWTNDRSTATNTKTSSTNEEDVDDDVNKESRNWSWFYNS